MVFSRFSLWSLTALIPDPDDYQTLVLLILIPGPLFFASTVFGVHGLTAWVVIGIIWCFCSAFTVVLYPLWESRVAIVEILSGVTKVRLFVRQRQIWY
jgi:hypothetical protein